MKLGDVVTFLGWKAVACRVEHCFMREGGVGLDALGDAFCWDEVRSKTAVGSGTFGHPHGERGKPGWMTPSLGREKGSWPF